MKRILTLLLIAAAILTSQTYTFANNSYIDIAFAILSNSAPIVGETIHVDPYAYDRFSLKDASRLRDIKYQWYRNDSESSSGGNAIEGATDKHYTITAEDEGGYIYCVLSGLKESEDVLTMPTSRIDATAELGGAAIFLGEDQDPYPCIDVPATAWIFRKGSEPREYSKYYTHRFFSDMIEDESVLEIQWYKNPIQSNEGGTPIDGAVSLEYVPTEGDFGFYLYYTVGGKEGYTGAVTSNVTAYPVSEDESLGGSTIAATRLPREIEITGAAARGATLSVEEYDHTEYQWYVNDVDDNTGGEPIAGANLTYYTVREQDIGKYIYVSTMSYKSEEELLYLTSEPTEAVAETCEITGATTEDIEPIRTERISSEPIPAGVNCLVQWYRNDAPENFGGDPILGATLKCYTPTAQDVGKYLYCVFTPEYPTVGEPMASNVTGAVQARHIILLDSNGGRREGWTCYHMYECEDMEEFVGRFMTPARGGCEFLGWADSPDAEEPNFDASSTIDSDKILYAVWKRNPGSYIPGSSTGFQPATGNNNSGSDIEEAVTGEIVSYMPYVIDADTEIDVSDYFMVKDENGEISAAEFEIDEAGENISKLSDGSFRTETAGESSVTVKDAEGRTLTSEFTVDSFATEGAEFTDISGHWAEEEIKKAAETGMIKGYEDNTFRPEESVSVEEFMTILTRLDPSGEPKERRELNISIDSSDWSENYIKNIINKMTSEQTEFVFGNALTASEPILRETAAYLLTFDNSGGDADSSFTDISDSKFRENIARSQSFGYFIGNPDNTFNPKAYITRAETAVVINRIERSL